MYFTKYVSDDFLELIITKFNPLLIAKSSFKWKCLECPLKSQVPDILKLYHDAHHPGINTTLTNIRREYCWLGMCEEVKLYVSVFISIINVLYMLWCYQVANLPKLFVC